MRSGNTRHACANFRRDSGQSHPAPVAAGAVRVIHPHGVRDNPIGIKQQRGGRTCGLGLVGFFRWWLARCCTIREWEYGSSPGAAIADGLYRSLRQSYTLFILIPIGRRKDHGRRITEPEPGKRIDGA
jgi:hypothetical protein